MGGDHKCPVCQATFTRPQHVARHMRSHTGDRPYKCQFCGDQFARSDLLARHVNKCHANEKTPANPTAGGRRKGSAAVSRATTSKQACDQCVQSSLPCDGSNPCSKCLSRKFRCTYVKFHRQTAPSGPGHHPPRSPSSSSSLAGSVGPSRFPPFIDDYTIPNTLPNVSAAYSGPDQIFNTPPFSFNPAAANSAAYPHNWVTPDVLQPPFTMGFDMDVAAKYRAQAVELFRRSSATLISGGPAVAHPSIYATQAHRHYHQQPPSLGHWYPPGWGEPETYALMEDTKSFDGGIERTHSLTSSEPASFAPGFYDAAGSIGSAYRPRRASLDFSDSSSTASHSVPSSAASSSLQLPLYEGHSEEIQRQTQCHDTPNVQRRGSMPTSQPPTTFLDLSGPAPVTPAPPAPPATIQPSQIVGEGGFSSAFGLMSIDDPNVLTGLSSDGVPFFSALCMGALPNSPNATPMPARVQHSHHHLQQGRERGMSLGTLPTSPGLTKDADARELKEMWRTYMRSPLSGSGSGSATNTGTAASDLSTPMPLAQMLQSPLSAAGQRRRMRVSSLPSVTPTTEKGYPSTMQGHGHGEGAGGGMMRTTLHGNPEDLRSYEAAVNARSASLKLNLVPRRRGTRPSLCGDSPPPPPSMEVAAASPASTCSAAALADPQEGISRPSSSSSSSSSSLAQAFNATAAGHQPHYAHPYPHMMKSPPMQGASISLPVPGLSSSDISTSLMPGGYGQHEHHSVSAFGSTPPFEPSNANSSRASSVASDGTSGSGSGSGSDGEVHRPSFKRCPSQTLGPANSKRALVERGAGVMSKGVKVEERGPGMMVVEERESELGMKEGKWEMDRDEKGRLSEGLGFERVTATGSPGSRPIAALPERAKRGQTYY